MAKRHLPDAELLRKLLRYDPETGKLYWLPRPVEMFKQGRLGSPKSRAMAWNKKHAGNEALTAKTTNGYLSGTVLGIKTKAHYIAWKMHHGSLPEQDIDHRNGDKTDNRADNLRLATPQQNQFNRARNRNNTAGYKGVTYHPGTQKWTARIKVDGKPFYLGLFSTPEKAHEAYCKASRAYHGEFSRVA
jgi:hypothetical protein